VPLTINPTDSPPRTLGVMVVGIENFSGRAEANLLRFGRGRTTTDEQQVAGPSRRPAFAGLSRLCRRAQ